MVSVSTMQPASRNTTLVARTLQRTRCVAASEGRQLFDSNSAGCSGSRREQRLSSCYNIIYILSLLPAECRYVYISYESIHCITVKPVHPQFSNAIYNTVFRRNSEHELHGSHSSTDSSWVQACSLEQSSPARLLSELASM